MNKKKIRSIGPFLLYETTVHKKKHANFSHPNLNNPTFKKLIKRKPLVRLISNFLCMILASICQYSQTFRFLPHFLHTKTTVHNKFLLWYLVLNLVIYGSKAAGREKSAPNVTKQPSLKDSSWPNGWSQQLVLRDSWQSLWADALAGFSSSWYARKHAQESIDFS